MGTTYKHSKEVGRGSTSVVYCYTDASQNKIAVKAARIGDYLARGVIEQEKCMNMDLMKKGLSCIPEFLDEGYLGDNPYIITEYIEQSIEDYLENVMDRKLNFSQILVQMVEAVQ